jgi:hypothetical protein
MTRHDRERRTVWLFTAAASALYWLFTLAISARKPLWNDELYTYYVARLPTMKDVWGALLAGGEQTPPFFYFLTRLSVSVLGLNATAIRLPEMIAFWMMGLCIGVFVARRTSGLYGVGAGTLPLLTGAYYFASEARPYGLVMGFGALAVLCWQSVALDRGRPAWLVGLALSLAAVVSSHYYGVFVLAAIAFGEMVRTATTGRIATGVWGAFAIALVPLGFQIPLLRAGASYAGTFWSPPQWVNIPDFYYTLLAPAVVPLATMAVCIGVYACLRTGSAHEAASPQPPVHELAALVGLLAIPVVCVLAAKLATGAFTNRYAIAAVIGAAALLPLIVRRLVWFPTTAALIVAVCGCAWFTFTGLRAIVEGPDAPVTTASLQSAIATIRSAPDRDLRIAVADPHTFTVLSHYAPDDLRPRLVYLADPARALKRLHQNSVERGMLDLIGPWFGMDVEPYETFVDAHSAFFVYGNFGALAFLNWLVPDLQDEHFRAELLAVQGDRLLLRVSHKRTAGERSNDGP